MVDIEGKLTYRFPSRILMVVTEKAVNRLNCLCVIPHPRRSERSVKATCKGSRNRMISRCSSTLPTNDLGIGDWGLGIGDWGLGIGDWGLAANTDLCELKKGEHVEPEAVAELED
jgi:hypothetical protein